MKKILCTLAILSALSGNPWAQALRLPQTLTTLNGTYAGNASGDDWGGHPIHQITKWTFRNNVLVNFQEQMTFWEGAGGFSQCLFTPQLTQNSYYVAFFGQQPDEFSDFALMASEGCPYPSNPGGGNPNQRPEVLQIIPDSTNSGFSYLEHTSGFQNSLPQINNPNPPAHLSGHAWRQ